MSKTAGFFSHLTVIFGMIFLVFLVLDQFNPMMNFIDNDVSRWMLAAFCASGIIGSILAWRNKSREPDPVPPDPVYSSER